MDTDRNGDPTRSAEEQQARSAEERRESGQPGGGQGRRDEVGGSGVYPASGPNAPADAELRTQAEWGQGDRGAAGYEDSGQSELFFYDAELRAAEEAEEREGGGPEEKRT